MSEPKPKSIEPVNEAQFKALCLTVTPMARMIGGLDDADLSKGRGVLEGNDRCLWTHDKRRITIYVHPDSLMIACGKEPDPHCP